MHGLPCLGFAASIRGCNMKHNIKNGPRKLRNGWILKSYLTHTHTLLGMFYNFCFIKFSVKCTVRPREVFWPKEASLRLNFFKYTQKPFLGHDHQLFQISLKLVQFYGSLQRIHTHTHIHIKLYILYKIARSLTFNIYLFSLNLFI